MAISSIFEVMVVSKNVVTTSPVIIGPWVTGPEVVLAVEADACCSSGRISLVVKIGASVVVSSMSSVTGSAVTDG